MLTIYAEIPLKYLYEKFWRKHKKIRIIRGYSQKKLGELLGFSARTISAWECGNTEPNILTIKKLSNVLQVSIEELFDF